MTTQHTVDENVIWRIQPSRESFSGQLAALWHYRSVSVALAQQVLSNRAERKLFGLPWMYLQPIALALPPILMLKVFKISVDPLPLSMFILPGLAIWMLMRRGIQLATRSLKLYRSLGRRIHVPAFMIVCASVSPAITQFLLFMIFVAGLAIYYGPILGVFYVPLGWHFLGLIPSVLLVLMLIIGLGSITAILYNMRQDTLIIMKYVFTGWMLITPILYPAEIIPEDHRWLLYVNPLTPIVEFFRFSLFGYGRVDIDLLLVAVMAVLILMLAGGTLFSKLQSRIFDYV
jgi:lipopolysaccharide transport system permease protein